MRNHIIIIPPKEVIDSIKRIEYHLREFKNEVVFTQDYLFHIQIHYLGDSLPKEVYQKALHELRSLYGEIPKKTLLLGAPTIGIQYQRQKRLLHLPVLNKEDIFELQKKTIQKLSKLPGSHLNRKRARMLRYPHLKVGILKERVSKSIRKAIVARLETFALGNVDFKPAETFIMKTYVSGIKKKYLLAEKIQFSQKK